MTEPRVTTWALQSYRVKGVDPGKGKSHQTEASQLANQSYNKPALTSSDHLLHRRPHLGHSQDPALPSFLGCCIGRMYQRMTHSFQKGQSVLRGTPIQALHTFSENAREGVWIKGHLGKGTRWAALCLTLVLSRGCVVVRALSPGHHNRPTQEPA